MVRFSNTHFGIRDLRCPQHLISDIAGFCIDKPTFINLGGNGAITSQKANGRCSRMERMMGLKARAKDVSSTYKDVNIISFVYGRDKESDTVGNFTKEEICLYVLTMLLPLFVDDDGKRLSTEEACKNFSKVIFYSHCYGAKAVNEIMDQLVKNLKELGYTPEDIAAICCSTIHITYSPLETDSWLPCIEVNSFTDSYNYSTGLRGWFKDKFGYDLNGVAIKYATKFAFQHLKTKRNCHKVISIYTSRLLNVESNKGSKVIDEHASDYLDLDYSWNGCEKAMGAKNSECVSKLVGYALSWAGARALQIERSNKYIELNIDELVEELDSVLAQYNANDLRY